MSWSVVLQRFICRFALGRIGKPPAGAKIPWGSAVGVVVVGVAIPCMPGGARHRLPGPRPPGLGLASLAGALLLSGLVCVCPLRLNLNTARLSAPLPYYRSSLVMPSFCESPGCAQKEVRIRPDGSCPEPDCPKFRASKRGANFVGKVNGAAAESHRLKKQRAERAELLEEAPSFSSLVLPLLPHQERQEDPGVPEDQEVPFVVSVEHLLECMGLVYRNEVLKDQISTMTDPTFAHDVLTRTQGWALQAATEQRWAMEVYATSQNLCTFPLL